MPIGCQIWQVGWKAELMGTAASNAKPCREDGAELRGAGTCREEGKDMLCMVKSARNAGRCGLWEMAVPSLGPRSPWQSSSIFA